MAHKSLDNSESNSSDRTSRTWRGRHCIPKKIELSKTVSIENDKQILTRKKRKNEKDSLGSLGSLETPYSKGGLASIKYVSASQLDEIDNSIITYDSCNINIKTSTLTSSDELSLFTTSIGKYSFF